MTNFLLGLVALTLWMPVSFVAMVVAAVRWVCKWGKSWRESWDA